MKVEFVASFALIAPDPPTSRALYVDALGLPLEQTDGEYYSSEEIPGAKHFGVWPLEQAAQACFGTTEWPSDKSVPQASVEFELGSSAARQLGSPAAVAEGAAELQEHGHALLHPAREEPWGQTVARVLSPEGAIVGLSYAPWMHDSTG